MWHIGQIKNTHFLQGPLSQKLLIAIVAIKMMPEIKKFTQKSWSIFLRFRPESFNKTPF